MSITNILLDAVLILISETGPLPTIVVSDEVSRAGAPIVQYAAEDLSRYLKSVTGRELSVGREQFDKICIHVGQTRYVKAMHVTENLSEDGFVICTRLRGKTPQLIISGRTLSGTVYGVHYFLRKYAGVNWLFPGKLGEIIRAQTEIKIPADLDERHEPSFQVRLVYSPSSVSKTFGMRNLQTWNASPTTTNPHDYSFVMKNQRKYRVEHAIYMSIPVELYDEHPEYFPLIKGKRQRPKHRAIWWQPCISNPEVLERFIKRAQQYFDENPEAKCFPISENDSGGYCECENCQAMDYPDAPRPWATDLCRNYSDRCWKFYVKVAEAIAKSHPGKRLGVYSYLWSNEPPSDPKLPDLLPDNIHIRKCFAHESDMERMERWSRLGMSMGFHDYISWESFLEYRHYPKQIAQELQWRYRQGMVAGLFEIHTRSSKGGPMEWILSRLLWNINEDVDELMNVYCDSAYGKASKPMRAFWDRWEEIWMRQPEPLTRSFHNRYAELYDQCTYTELDDLKYFTDKLKKAKHLAITDDDQKRVEMVALEYDMNQSFIKSVLLDRHLRDSFSEESSIGKVIELMAKLARAEKYRLDRWSIPGKPPELGNAGSLFTLPKTLMHPESTLDEAAFYISKKLGGLDSKTKIRSFWLKVMKEYPELEQYSKSQLYCINALTQDNLILNPSFKKENKGWADWEISENSYVYQPSPREIGEESIDILGFAGFLRKDGISQVVPVVPGNRYQGAFQIKMPILNQNRMARGDMGKVHVSLSWLCDGKPLKSVADSMVETKKQSARWRSIAVSATAPESAIAVRFSVSSVYFIGDEKLYIKSPQLQCISK